MRDRQVFINCPFDEEYAPLLQAMLFTFVFLGYQPRLASEAVTPVVTRMDRINELILASRYSVHDLSRGHAALIGIKRDSAALHGCSPYRG